MSERNEAGSASSAIALVGADRGKARRMRQAKDKDFQSQEIDADSFAVAPNQHFELLYKMQLQTYQQLRALYSVAFTTYLVPTATPWVNSASEDRSQVAFVEATRPEPPSPQPNFFVVANACGASFA